MADKSDSEAVALLMEAIVTTPDTNSEPQYQSQHRDLQECYYSDSDNEKATEFLRRIGKHQHKKKNSVKKRVTFLVYF
ncbi:tegument phosphoprotein [Cercopithecine alphaherpesvirus 9]|uniref:Envelope protein US9 homolog n=1 Tax=Cercopithecine herpesvirus 9 (strain DHV) TaxID=36348 RepID=US9_CHV9D|nr:membrane protein US9 [Cercopithecine alphaherpesvirus 9]Q04546.1 RecName: Full=Envelope protein US9 homolog; AltName: Full=Envelope protein 65; AltName: Full=ORF65 protein [Cercopithecine herpesvirus 9 (strain DHV)]AAA47886.1 tegument protein [Cercopithecine alphaherpesvirus 9]AAG27240.1 tegument phosphoprotein [Cercopithecine alphaherpesvirus 9]